MSVPQEVIMSDHQHHKSNFNPCRDMGESRKTDDSISKEMELLDSISDHVLKVSTTMQGTINDPEKAERIRELIKKLK